MNDSQIETKTSKKPGGSTGLGIRQAVLFGLLLIVLTAFLIDKYWLMPSTQEKISAIENEVTMTLTSDNRRQVHETIVRKPSNVFSYRGLDVEQYRFPRGLPFFPKPILDIAYSGDAIAFYRIGEPMDNDFIDSKLKDQEAKISPLKEGPREIEIRAAGSGT